MTVAVAVLFDGRRVARACVGHAGGNLELTKCGGLCDDRHAGARARGHVTERHGHDAVRLAACCGRAEGHTSRQRDGERDALGRVGAGIACRHCESDVVALNHGLCARTDRDADVRRRHLRLIDRDAGRSRVIRRVGIGRRRCSCVADNWSEPAAPGVTMMVTDALAPDAIDAKLAVTTPAL